MHPFPPIVLIDFSAFALSCLFSFSCVCCYDGTSLSPSPSLSIFLRSSSLSSIHPLSVSAPLLPAVLYIFTVVGVELMAKVAYNGSYDIHCNFRSFGLGFLALIRFLTGI